MSLLSLLISLKHPWWIKVWLQYCLLKLLDEIMSCVVLFVIIEDCWYCIRKCHMIYIVSGLFVTESSSSSSSFVFTGVGEALSCRRGFLRNQRRVRLHSQSRQHAAELLPLRDAQVRSLSCSCYTFLNQTP